MWENERKKTIIRNIVVLIVLVAAAGGLLMAMKNVSQQIAAEDALLSAEHSSQRQELNEARQENLAAVQKTYEEHLSAVAQYLPGIVCWGDSLTSGSSGNVSYPLTLQKYIDTYLCDIYDLRYSVENPENYSRLNWNEYKISVPVVNMGGGQENSETILGRSGIQSYVLNRDAVIPAAKESVFVSIKSQNGKTVTPMVSGAAGINPVTIAGVEGTLVRTAKSQAKGLTYYEFTRLEEGQEVAAEKGTEVKSASEQMYQDYIHIVWLGTYGDVVKPEVLVNNTKALLARQTANTDRYLVIGPCTYGGSWDPRMTYSMDSLDSAMMQAFGDHYVNVRKYLIEDGLRDANLGETKLDTEYIAKGRVPDSFRSNAGGADLNAVAYSLLGELIYERMELLGYFEEVRSELNLNKITQDILKNEPGYFNRLLSR